MNAFAEHFTKQIESDLDWREREMAILRKQLYQTTVGSAQEATFLRTNLAMTYAHYEGFCKFALGIYIDALEKLSLKRTDLSWRLAALSLTTLHGELLNIKDANEYFTKLLTDLNSHLNARAKYERPDNISNLWPDLLASWLTRLDLDATSVQIVKARLHSLVTNRNQIAHGKSLSVANRTELDAHVYAATLAMHEVAVGVVEALEHKRYARASHHTTVISHAIA